MWPGANLKPKTMSRAAYKIADEYLGKIQAAEESLTQEDRLNAIEYVISELFKSIKLIIFKTDSEGNIVFKNGRPQIDVVNIVTGVFKLVGRIIVLVTLRETKNLAYVPNRNKKAPTE